MFKAVSNKADFAAAELEVLKFWQENGTFEKSLELRRRNGEFVFYDGPPFATGLPHYGHLLAGTIKDIVPRYQTMRGMFVDRRFGWDCHGLPVEYEVEQDLEISGKRDIEKMGVANFNEKCRSIVLRYTREWRQIVTRMGRWVDFDRDYKTMDAQYMESIWWVFRTLWEKGLIYEGSKILPYCTRCATPLSNFETNQGYKDVADPAITIRFAVEGAPDTYILAWTTTPWTLPSNMALAVGRDIAYAKVVDPDGTTYILAKDRVQSYYRKESDYKSISYVKGSDLVGLKYEPLFPYFASLKTKGAFRVVAADFVSTEDGTGVVHIAPGFGEDDHALGQKEGLPGVCPIDEEGRFTAEVTDYAGRHVKETDADIMARLKKERKQIHRGTINHSYPHCWRCDSPLIYRMIATWFVRVEKIKDRLLAANKQIHWMPEHLRDGRFGKWLEGARDWAISRNRYWGAPLPVWKSKDGKETVCVGSIAELEKLSGRKVADLHKHVVDEIEIPSREGRGALRRIPEVLDCWFESGAMPYAQAHYPFENREHFEKHFPADFIAEGLDQTRGWFYTLMVLSVALFDKPAFRNVVVNGLVLAEDGRKMSKRLKNYPDPVEMINAYGADALRLYMVYSPVVRAEDLCFSEAGVKHLVRHLMIPLWNAHSFFVTYANVDGWTADQASGKPSPHLLDRWIRSSLETLKADVVAAMDSYDLQRGVRPFVRFIEDLTNWYIRRSRRRFWKSQDDDDKKSAYETLHHVLLELSKVAAPFVPFMSEGIYRNLRSKGMPESVHLCDYPLADASKRDLALEEQMDRVITAVRLGRQLRAEHELKVRQPLAKVHVVSRNDAVRKGIQAVEDLVRDELNVRQIVFDADETGLVDLRAKPDFKRLGPKLGARVKKAAQVISALPQETLVKLAGGGTATIRVESEEVTLESADVVLERLPKEGMVVASEGDLVVALETKLDHDLVLDGLAREIVNRTQNQRKAAGLNVVDRIRREYWSDDPVIHDAEKHWRTRIDSEVLCNDSKAVAGKPAGDGWVVCDLNGHPYIFRIEATGETSNEGYASADGADSEE